MPFRSILFTDPDMPLRAEAPACFADLHLDQFFAAVVAGRQEYDLLPYFYSLPGSMEAVTYRQAVMRDIEIPEARKALQAFARDMNEMRQREAILEKLHEALEKQRWFLAAVQSYVDAVEELVRALRELPLRSKGMQDFRVFLRAYAESGPFQQMATECRRIIATLAAIRFGALIVGLRITVRPAEPEPDYTTLVEQTFERFRKGDVKDYLAKYERPVGLNHVEGAVVERVARLHPQPFADMASFCLGRADFRHREVVRFDREVQFYVSYREQMERLRRAGLFFSSPQLSEDAKTVRCVDAFDVALASQAKADATQVVCNDVELQDAERILVVSGPNQGGKTTYARMVGQLHYLAALGCPVPAREARMPLVDSVLSHFEREEQIADLRGKLHDDLARMHSLLAHATPRTLVVMNEAFSSTTLEDAVFLSKKVLAKLSQLDALAVCVTFITELSEFNEKTVSVVGSVSDADPAVRTFKLLRRPADGLAYAAAIARKHRLTFANLMERISP